jgi:hypothetical protein
MRIMHWVRRTREINARVHSVVISVVVMGSLISMKVSVASGSGNSPQ